VFRSRKIGVFGFAAEPMSPEMIGGIFGIQAAQLQEKTTALEITTLTTEVELPIVRPIRSTSRCHRWT